MARKLKKSEHEKVVRHLKGDIAGYKKEAEEDRDLIKHLRPGKEKKAVKKKEHKALKKAHKKRSDLKMDKVFHEFGQGMLHSGSKHGPVVTNPKQAQAIAFSEARKLYKKKKK